MNLTCTFIMVSSFTTRFCSFPHPSIADFYPYALLDLVDKQLGAAHSKISKKDYDEAYFILETLVAFNNMDSPWQSMYTIFQRNSRPSSFL